ncbi:DUF1778 domain-containing protein [Simplicispira psychrophila]|uniref:type II toxin -antitoxin system TacA 1-like antitoxin n=1 Tax=Simplicispira psychrophila TaxID=80882 RepID=UPI00068B0C94|nr:DUF1778 domain-containing protein [Simplicispira psychrophila]
MTDKLLPFDMARYLGSDEAIAEYLTQVLADGDGDELRSALGHIAKARCHHFVLDEVQWQVFEQALNRPVQTKPRLERLLNDSGLLG